MNFLVCGTTQTTPVLEIFYSFTRTNLSCSQACFVRARQNRAEAKFSECVNFAGSRRRVLSTLRVQVCPGSFQEIRTLRIRSSKTLRNLLDAVKKDFFEHFHRFGSCLVWFSNLWIDTYRTLNSMPSTKYAVSPYMKSNY
jgi:hypothetical protein